MTKEEMFLIIKDLSFDNEHVVFNGANIDVYLLRPSVLSRAFEGYDRNKNFQIWLREGVRKFRPNHLRLCIDLNLRVRSRPELKRSLLLGFDKIFYGEAPEVALRGLAEEDFEHCLNPLIVIGNLHQLFIIEQEYCYHRESRYSPVTLFLQGWIRQFLDSPQEIDNLCMSVANRQPPATKYTCLENRKNRRYTPSLRPLWYIGG